MEFVRRFLYGGKNGEDLVDTKVRMYKEQSKKTTSSLPPDPNSLRFDILRKHYQSFIWRKCLEPHIECLPLNENGWKECDDNIVPVWYICSQLPPSMSKNDKSGYQADMEVDAEWDGEICNDFAQPPLKRSRECGKRSIRTVLPKQKARTTVDKKSLANVVNFADSDEDSREWERLSDFCLSDLSDESDWEL